MQGIEEVVNNQERRQQVPHFLVLQVLGIVSLVYILFYMLLEIENWITVCFTLCFEHYMLFFKTSRISA